MRKSIELVAGEAAYAGLTTFETVEQLNETVRHYKDAINDMSLRQDVKRNLLTVIEYIKRHSCRFFGVSFKGKRKIAADLKMSDRTVIRVCKRLEALGFIKQYETRRPTDRQQTSNAIVIQPVKSENVLAFEAENNENVRPVQPKMSDQENNISLKQNNNLLHNTYQPTAPVNYYQRFKQFITSKMDVQQSLISRLFGVYKAHSTAFVKYGAFAVEDVEHVGYEALRVAVMQTKHRRIENLPGFYNGVLDRMLDRLYLESLSI